MSIRKLCRFIGSIIVFVLVFPSSIAVLGQQPTDLPNASYYAGIQMQNLGAAEAQATITIAGFVNTYTIPVNSSITLLPHQIRCSATADLASSTELALINAKNSNRGLQASSADTYFLPIANTNCSSRGIVINANQPLNIIETITNRPINVDGNAYGVAGGLAASQHRVGATATTLNFPLVKNNFFGKTTVFYIQNAGSTATSATATFKTNAGQTFNFTTSTFQPEATLVLLPVSAGFPSGNTDGIGSLSVTSAQPLAGVVLEVGGESPGKVLQATIGFTPNEQDTRLFAPIIKNEFANRFTGLQVQNVGVSSVDFTVTYTGGSGCVGQTFSSIKTGLAAGASHTFVHRASQDSPMPVGCLAAATILASGPIIAIVNEGYTPEFLTNGGNGGRQETTTYSTFAHKNATAKLSVPLYKENSFNKGSGLQVQNVGSATATNLVATFTSAVGAFVTKPQTLAAGAALTFVEMHKKPELFSGTPIPATISGVNGVFAVAVTADQPIIGIVNESTYPFVNPTLEQDKSNYEAQNQ